MRIKQIRILILLFLALGFIPCAWAAENTQINYSIEPFLRYSFVDGDREKFREDNWINDKLAGGAQEFSLTRNKDDLKLEVEGRAIVNENDYKLNLNMVKEGVFTLKAGFKEFRKYYDGTGGYYSRFTTFPFIELSRDLSLNDRTFYLDFVYQKPDSNAYFINYEQHAKSGVISMLDWASVFESISGTSTEKKISPTWKEVEEVQHTVKFGTEGNKKLLSKDVHWKAEETLIYFDQESTIQERKYSAITTDLSNTSNSTNVTEQKPETKSHSTALLGDTRINDWLFVSSVAEYEHIHASEEENLNELNTATGIPTNFTSTTSNYFNASGLNDVDTYGWVTSFLLEPLKYLSASANIKAELSKRSSSSIYPRDTTLGAINTVGIDNTIYSDTNRDDKSLEELLSVKFTKMPRTVLYLNGEFEQLDGHLLEDRNSVGATDNTYNREMDIETYKNTLATGINWYPYSFLNISSEYKKNLGDTQYPNRSETVSNGTDLSTDMVDEQNFQGDFFTTKVNIKPCKWLHTTLKYQLSNTEIYTTVVGEGRTKATQDVNTYMATVTLIPRYDFYLTGMFTRQTALSNTVASLSSTANLPAYEANFNTVMFSATYVFNPKTSLSAEYQWVRANNFNDYSLTGLPYGLDNRLQRILLTFRQEIKENLSTEIKYGYDDYDENSNNNIDNYKAHIIACSLKYLF